MSPRLSAVRRLQFCAGHRVWKHESKCNHLHGHNYVAFIHAEAPQLDAIGRVIDFSVLKEKIGGWIDAHWDHGFVYHKDDTATEQALAHIQPQKKFPMPDNPTAENMAKYLLLEVCPAQLAGTGVTVTKVVLWETENAFAEAVL
jgi:6-pyruvoyltetrahydropterin/6-carboxytetrahydropterin synthase